jgi:hypothetical protein
MILFPMEVNMIRKTLPTLFILACISLPAGCVPGRQFLRRVGLLPG